MSSIAFEIITELVNLHNESGLFICSNCNDGQAFCLQKMAAHLQKNHDQAQSAAFQDKMKSLPNTLVNSNICIPGMTPTKGLKCTNCSLISKQKNLPSFKQWHTEKSPACKDANMLSVDIQIRDGIAYEFAAPTAQNGDSFFHNISQQFHAKVFFAVADDDLYTSNPLQVFFEIFTIFGRSIDYELLTAYKHVWNEQDLLTVRHGFRKFFSETSSKLCTRDVIRSIMGSGMQMFQFKRSAGSFDSIGKLWAKILNICVNSTSELFNVPESVRGKAIAYFRIRSVLNLKKFVIEV